MARRLSAPVVPDQCRKARKASASVVVDAKTGVWEEFGEAISVPIKEILTIRQLRKGMCRL